MPAPTSRRQMLAWASYDWANSAFATTVMAAFFPVFFKEYWNAGVSAQESSWRLGVTSGVASVAVAATAPLLGALADRSRARKPFLLFFTLIGGLATGALYLVSPGRWLYAAALFGLGSFAFGAGLIFYDSLLVSVAPRGREDWVSALGYAMGYLGGGLLFVGNVLTVLWPQRFGLADQAAAVRLAFLSVALWWLAFAVPLFLWVPEPGGEKGARGTAALRAAYRQLADTFRQVRRTRSAFLFLAAYWLYIDGVDTVIRMAVDYGMALNFPTHSLLVALAITQVVGFPAALLFGRLGERLGTRTMLLAGIGVYVGVTVWGFCMQNVAEFYGLAVVVGLVQGGVQALSRSYYARLIPPDRASEFFGFYNMLGKFAAVLGPPMVGWVGVYTGSSRYGLLSLILLFGAGGFLLTRVRPDAANRSLAQT